MQPFTRSQSRDPDRIRVSLEQLCENLKTRMGDELESIIAYGSFVRFGELVSEQDSLNLMLVVRHVTYEVLDKLAGLISRAEKEIPLSTMILTREDLISSCDVFPVKFQDMKLHHRVMIGGDVFIDLSISESHLRLRCEQLLKNLMLRMRAAYLQHSHSRKLLLQTLLDANRQLIQEMHACLIVKCGMAPDEVVDLPTAYGEAFGLNTDVVNEVFAIRQEKQLMQLDELKAKFGRLMQLVQDSAKAMDELEVSS